MIESLFDMIRNSVGHVDTDTLDASSRKHSKRSSRDIDMLYAESTPKPLPLATQIITALQAVINVIEALSYDQKLRKRRKLWRPPSSESLSSDGGSIASIPEPATTELRETYVMHTNMLVSQSCLCL